MSNVGEGFIAKEEDKKYLLYGNLYSSKFLLISLTDVLPFCVQLFVYLRESTINEKCLSVSGYVVYIKGNSMALKLSRNVC